ncbi:MAG: S24 family peptidase [Anaerolineales bacterium]|nr:S24 family peptidase [Anaerolineales bacterium]
MSMDIVKKNCDRWIGYAYLNWLTWLRNTKQGQYYLRESTRIYVDRMKTAAENDQKEETWNLLERLKKLGSNIHGMRNDFGGGDSFLYEQAEIHLECAIVAYKMGDTPEALSLLEMTVSSFQGRSIHKAVTCWVYGCIQWQSQSHLEEALVNWEKSYHIMNELASSSSFDQTFAEKCEDIKKDMGDAIRAASLENNPPPPPFPARTAAASRPAKRASASLQRASVRLFPIFGSIPAGSPANMMDISDDRARIDGFEIEGVFHDAYNLGGGTEVNLVQGREHYFLKVKGESMNNAQPVNIENGDYVLVAKQDAAESGSIVVAEIENIDHEATLKRYYLRNGKHILEPESRNESLKEHLTFQKDFRIRGMALAVLKPHES